MDWNDFPAVPTGHLNTRAFLDFLGKAEGADYNTIVGGGKFNSFDAHPNIVGLRTADGPSTAAGRYQITGTTYRDVAPKLGITDFSPESQDRIAIELIKRKGALQDIERGDYNAAIDKLGGTWASLPSSPYNQPKRSQSWVEKTINAMIPAAQAGETRNMPKQASSWDDFPVAAQQAAPQSSSGGWDAFPEAGKAAPKQTNEFGTDTIPVAPPVPVESAPLPDITPGAQQAPQPQAAPAAPKDRKLSDSGFNSDPVWIKNAKTLYKDVEGKDFAGDDAAAADWLKNYVAQTKWNLVGAGTTIKDALANMSPEGKQALLQSIDEYGKAPTSWESVGRAAKGIATDPTTYAGLGVGSIITKTLGKEAALTALKEALLAGMTKKGISAATTKAAASGAGYGAVNNAVTEQGVKMAADGQEGFDLGESLWAATKGAAGGVVANKVINKLTGRSAMEKLGKKAGNEETARINAEIAQDFNEVAKNPNLKATNEAGEPTIAAAMRNNKAARYVDDVENAMKRTDPETLKQYDVQNILNGDRTATVAELESLKNNPATEALGYALEKYQKAMALTAPTPASNSIPAKAARGLIENAPRMLAAAAGANSFGLSGLLFGLLNPGSSKLSGMAQRWTGKSSIPENISKIASDDAVSNANKVIELLGPSKAKTLATDLAEQARQIDAEKFANKAQKATEKAADKQASQEAQQAAEQLRQRNLNHYGIQPSPKLMPQSQIGGGPKATLQYYGRLKDADEVTKGLNIIKEQEPYLSKYIDALNDNQKIPQSEMLLHISDRLLQMRDQGILAPFIKKTK